MSILNPYVLLGFLVWSIVVGGFSFWKGYQYADKSAEIAALNGRIAAAEIVIKEQQAAMARSNKALDDARAREAAGQDYLAELEGMINELAQSEADKPAADACRLDGASFDLLRKLAAAAAHITDRASPAPGRVR